MENFTERGEAVTFGPALVPESATSSDSPVVVTTNLADWVPTDCGVTVIDSAHESRGAIGAEQPFSTLNSEALDPSSWTCETVIAVLPRLVNRTTFGVLVRPVPWELNRTEVGETATAVGCADASNDPENCQSSTSATPTAFFTEVPRPTRNYSHPVFITLIKC